MKTQNREPVTDWEVRHEIITAQEIIQALIQQVYQDNPHPSRILNLKMRRAAESIVRLEGILNGYQEIPFSMCTDSPLLQLLGVSTPAPVPEGGDDA
jgi:hypothetical protein